MPLCDSAAIMVGVDSDQHSPSSFSFNLTFGLPFSSVSCIAC